MTQVTFAQVITRFKGTYRLKIGVTNPNVTKVTPYNTW